MKYILGILISMLIFTTLLLPYHTLAFTNVDNQIELTDQEKQWLYENKSRVLKLGIDPHSGMTYFKYQGRERGYVIPLINIIKKDLGLNIKLEASKNWTEIYSGLKTGSIDILLGANETPERKKFMEFTHPINKSSYAIIAKKDSSINTIGDIDNKRVGFIKDDIVIGLLPSAYKNIKYKQSIYNSQEDAIQALNRDEVDAFIMPGGSIVYEYIYRFPKLTYAFKLYSINSYMTLSTRKEDSVLANILDKEIKRLEKSKLNNILNQNEVEYNIKIMNLTEKEIKWLKNDGEAIVGVTKDYLPFDYYNNRVYKGISGEIIEAISKKTGIKFINLYGDFDELETKLKNGQIDILNIAKTDKRMEYLLYPRPYSTERDIIIGRKDSMDVRDIFGLEGKRVAVIKGFWHYEHLMKNLVSVNIIETSNIQESLKLVHAGKADYLIENPTVARYYIEELQLYDLVEKGVTSTDSYLYYGITKRKPELASIIDKAIPLIDIDELRKKGYEEVPHESHKLYYKKLVFTIIGLSFLLLIVILYLIKLVKDLVKEKTESELLRQREELLFMDSLTLVYNRNYFNTKIKDKINNMKYPQTIIVTDMNNLKKVNDKYGHHIGDELLKLFASVLRELCPENTLIFRMGGDEFHIFMEDINDKQAEDLISYIRYYLEFKASIEVEGDYISPTAAFGYASRKSNVEGYEDMVRIADKRMYRDKNEYKNI